MGLPSGLNSVAGAQWSAKYVLCYRNRTIEVASCRKGVFNPVKRICDDHILIGTSFFLNKIHVLNHYAVKHKIIVSSYIYLIFQNLIAVFYQCKYIFYLKDNIYNLLNNSITKKKGNCFQSKAWYKHICFDYWTQCCLIHNMDEDYLISMLIIFILLCLNLADRYCQANPGSIVAHSANCAQYYNCSQKNTRLGGYLMECPYPQLFSMITTSCQNFTTTDCQNRFEPQAPCKYKKERKV